MTLQGHRRSRWDSLAPVPGCRTASAAIWSLTICLVALPYLQTAHSQGACMLPTYYYDENSNRLGPNRCVSNCDCDGMRLCAASGWCQGVARLSLPPPPPWFNHSGCQHISGYTLQVGVDHDGDDLAPCGMYVELTAGAAMCSADPACKAFSFLNATSTGFGMGCRKRVTGPTAAVVWGTSSCFYVKIQPGGAPPGAPPAAPAPSPPRPSFSSLRNLALSQPTYASSNTLQSYLAVDGDKSTSGIFSTMPWNDYGNWLSVDLGVSCTVHFVVLYARKDCCGEQLINTEIRIGNTAISTPMAITSTRNSLMENNLVEVLNKYGEGVTGAVYNVSVNPPRTGRWVTVQNFNDNNRATEKSLAMLELEVYGTGCGGARDSSPSTYSGGGGGGTSATFRFIYVFPIVGAISILSALAIAVRRTIIKRRLQQQQQGSILTAGQQAPQHNAIAVGISPPRPPPPPPPAAAPPAIGTPVYGTPVGLYSGEPAGAIPTYVALVGGRDQAAADMPEWMRKRMEQQQQQQQGAAPSGSGAAVSPPLLGVPPSAGFGAAVAAAPAAASGSCTPALPVEGTGTAASTSAAPRDDASTPLGVDMVVVSTPVVIADGAAANQLLEGAAAAAPPPPPPPQGWLVSPAATSSNQQQQQQEQLPLAVAGTPPLGHLPGWARR